MASRLKTLSHQVQLRGKRVLLRLDINSPLTTTSRGTLQVADDSRIREAVPAIVRLQQAGAKIIVVAHLGDPDGKVVRELRMQPIVKCLREHLAESHHVVNAATHWDFARLQKDVQRLEPGDVLVLENVRFEKGEKTNDAVFAQSLASLADLYVNEAFSVSHRKHASVVAICRYLPHYAGWRLAQEVEMLQRVRTKSKQPFVLMVGGAKVHDKIGMMVALAPKATTILVGGIIANTVLKVRRTPVGRSRVDDKPPVKALKQLLSIERRIPGDGQVPLIQLPIDVVVARNLEAKPTVVNFQKGERVKETDTIYDIGPATIGLFAESLRRAKTIVWNGPMGLIEVPRYRHGSTALARLIAARSRGKAFSVVGGGESLEVLSEIGQARDVDFCSTGGGAMLEYLAGKKLPGIEALKK